MAKQFNERRGSPARKIILYLSDMVIVGAGFIAAHEIYGDIFSVLHIYAAIFSAGFFIFIANALDLYGSKSKHNQKISFGKIIVVWFVTLSTLLLFAYATKTSSTFSRVSVTGWIVATPVLQYTSHYFLNFFYQKIVQRGVFSAIAIAGTGKSAVDFFRSVESSPELRMKVAAVYALGVEEGGAFEAIDSGLVRGDLRQLVIDAKSGKYDEIYIALPMQSESEITFLIDQLSDCSVPVFFIPDIFAATMLSSQIYHFNGIPIVGIQDASMDGADLFLKRTEDLVIGSIILLLIALPMLIIAAIIKFTSAGPIIFRQKRYGLGGDSIDVWKFRSMTVCDNGQTVVQATKNDSRITPFGAFLRKTSLDELPQFFNVIKGDMSIVGPRPHAVAHNELYRKKIQGYMLRHLVKPGITGWAQINGWRGETDTLEKMEQRVKYDLEYIKNWSLWLDLKIIALTIIRGFVGKNVY